MGNPLESSPYNHTGPGANGNASPRNVVTLITATVPAGGQHRYSSGKNAGWHSSEQRSIPGGPVATGTAVYAWYFKRTPRRLPTEGKKPISTSVYEHNFYMLDHQPAAIPGESSSPLSSLVARSPYQQPKYPVHADKDSDNRFFYHLTLIDGQPPISVRKRLAAGIPVPVSGLASQSGV